MPSRARSLCWQIRLRPVLSTVKLLMTDCSSTLATSRARVHQTFYLITGHATRSCLPRLRGLIEKVHQSIIAHVLRPPATRCVVFELHPVGEKTPYNDETQCSKQLEAVLMEIFRSKSGENSVERTKWRRDVTVIIVLSRFMFT